MSIQVKKHWAERFLDWYPYNTRLYIRKKRNQNANFMRDGKELFDQLVPFFEKFRNEVLEEAAQYVDQHGRYEQDFTAIDAAAYIRSLKR